MCALLDSGARRNVLPLPHVDSIPTEFRPPLQPSTAMVLQGIGPGFLTALGEATLPMHMGNETTDVNFIIANITESTEVILGHPFLLQALLQISNIGDTSSEWPAPQYWSRVVSMYSLAFWPTPHLGQGHDVKPH